MEDRIETRSTRKTFAKVQIEGTTTLAFPFQTAKAMAEEPVKHCSNAEDGYTTEVSDTTFLFQTAKAIAEEPVKHCSNTEDGYTTEGSDTRVKFPFQKARTLLQNSISNNIKITSNKVDENNNEQSMDVDFEHDEVPFSEEQVKEFGGRSKMMLGFQTARQCQDNGFESKEVKDKLPDPYSLTPGKLLTEPSSPIDQPFVNPFEEPKVVPEDISKVLAKYEVLNQNKGPKKKVVFGKKNTLKSSASRSSRNDSQKVEVNSTPDTSDTTVSTNITNTSHESENVTKSVEVEKKKVVFARKPRQSFDQMITDQKLTEETEQSQGEKNKRALRKRALLKKDTDVSSSYTEREEYLEDSDEEVFDDSDNDEDFVPDDFFKESKGKIKFVFPQRQKRFDKIKPDSEVFKVPDVDVFLNLKQKTQRTEKSSQANPKVVTSFNRSSSSGTKNSQTNAAPSSQRSNFNRSSSSGTKNSQTNAAISSQRSHFNRSSYSGTKNSQTNAATSSQRSNFKPLGNKGAQQTRNISRNDPFNPRAELAALDSKSVVKIMYHGKFRSNVTKRRVVAASAKSACEPEDFGPEYFHVSKKAKLEVPPKRLTKKPVVVPRGGPIKVPPHLPDLMGAFSPGGQQVLFNPNKSRPLLFQSRAEAEWWDAATYINFRRMKSQLESGEYLHPDLNREVEEKMLTEMQELEVNVSLAVRRLEYRTLIEKYVLIQHEELLVRTSSYIDQWLAECFDMSPCSLSEMIQYFNQLLRIPTTFVMMKKTVYLAKLYWNMAELKQGMWANLLSQRAHEVLQHFRENFELTRPFIKINYEDALFDLVAESRATVDMLPLHERILITHSMDEEQSWTRQDAIILTTKLHADENSLHGYEVTENDRKNLLMLMLLLVFSNKISQPVFLPRNRVGASQKTNYGFKDYGKPSFKDHGAIVTDISEKFDAIQEEEYDYYDEWNFRVKPKRIKRSRQLEGEESPVTSNKKSKTNLDITPGEPLIDFIPKVVDSFDCDNSITLDFSEEIDFPEELTNHSKTLDTFDYDIGGATEEDLKILDTQNIQKTVGTLLINLTNEIFESHPLIIAETSISSVDKKSDNVENLAKFKDTLRGHTGGILVNDHNEKSYEVKPIALYDKPMWSNTVIYNKYSNGTVVDDDSLKTHDVLFNTLRILNDDSYGQMEMFDDNTCVQTETCNQESSDISVVENRVHFSSEEMRLVYGILGSELEAVVPEIQNTKYETHHINSMNDSPMKSFSQGDPFQMKSYSQGKIVPDISETIEDNYLTHFDNPALYDLMEGSIDHEFDDIKTNMCQDDENVIDALEDLSGESFQRESLNVESLQMENHYSKMFQMENILVENCEASKLQMLKESMHASYEEHIHDEMVPLNCMITINNNSEMDKTKLKNVTVIESHANFNSRIDRTELLNNEFILDTNNTSEMDVNVDDSYNSEKTEIKRKAEVMKMYKQPETFLVAVIDKSDFEESLETQKNAQKLIKKEDIDMEESNQEQM